MVLRVALRVERGLSSVRVEFVGFPRELAAVAAREVDARRLADVFARLEADHPSLARMCFSEGRLRGGFLVSVNGGRFVTDPATPLDPGDTVILLSADAGG